MLMEGPARLHPETIPVRNCDPKSQGPTVWLVLGVVWQDGQVPTKMEAPGNFQPAVAARLCPPGAA